MTCQLLSKTGILFLFILFTSCASVPKGSFGNHVSVATDYSLLKNWAALPFQKDSADAVPIHVWRDNQDSAEVDVFFLHPTTYTGHAGEKLWNADLEDNKVNLRTDKSSIRYQASIFNGAGKVYAPRYRQAHLKCYYTDKKADAAKAFDLAYQDVRSAFQYYLEHYNQNRPFIIASHSQGTDHAKRLILEEIDGKPVQDQLVVAYLVGFAVAENHFKNINPCRSPEETGCFCSWRTFKEGFIPPKIHYPDTNVLVTNPVTWDSTKPESEKSQQLGAILREFYKLYPALVETKIYKDLLWVNKPKFPGSFFLTTKNYHIADYNFFYADVRQNAMDRVHAFLLKR
jgi:hypothetical protein